MRLNFNSNGRAMLAATDRAQLEAGSDPGDNGSGRRFAVIDDTRLVLIMPDSLEPIELGWYTDGDQGDDQDDATGLAERDQTIAELREQLEDANATIVRVMAQRDEAIRRAADREARPARDAAAVATMRISSASRTAPPPIRRHED